MNVVAIVGRPNVGKSTIFNRLTGQRNAIVDDNPGITRDRIYGNADWNGRFFMLIDTGGFIPGSEDEMERAIREQAEIAIREADSIVFICDARTGPTPFDEDIANILRKSNKPVILVINKSDNFDYDLSSYEFNRLGIGEPFPLSALNGRGTGEFLDSLVDSLPEQGEEFQEDTRLKIAVVGRPNVGKSSITNSLTGEYRSIVTNIPGTTRDSIDSVVKYYGEEIILIDTAGLRRRSHVKENVEMYSVFRTARAIERCDIAAVILDAERGLEEQDKKIINQVDEARKGILLVINKWDLIEKDTKTADEFTRKVREELKTYDYIPTLFTSALTKQRITKIIDLSKKIQERRSTRISTSKLNDVILPELEKTPPPSIKGRDLRINYITQVKVCPPVFALFLNFPLLLPDAYKRYIERTIRRNFDFEGVPISLIFRRKNVSWEELHEDENS